MAWQVIVGVLAGLALLWIVLVIVLAVVARRHPGIDWREGLRILPDTVRLLRRVVADPTVPTGVRVRVALLLAYLLFPLDLVPDFIPVVGYADDAIVVVLAVRSIVRRAGSETLRRHWPGSAAGLQVLARFTGLEEAA